ncbi:MAG TPA: hypothetical protein VJN44_15800 [Roseateles sp.]|nr:hypothetical protein [Roseateles sp.]
MRHLYSQAVQRATAAPDRRRLLLGACLAPLLAAAEARAQPPQRPVLRVGPGRAVRSLGEAARQARDGMLIEVDTGEYPGDVAVWRQNDLSLKAVGGRVRLPAGSAVAEGKGIFVSAGERIAIEGFDFSGARAPDGNGAGIRLERGSLRLVDCSFSDCQMGLLSSDDAAARLELLDCEFSRAATRPGDAPAHLLYVGGIARLSVSGCYFHQGRIGHLLKSRAAHNLITYNRLTDELGGRASYELEFPNGGVAVLLGNLVQQSAQTENPYLIVYGAEGLAPRGRHELCLAHNTLVDNLPRDGAYLRVAPGPVRVRAFNNLLVGNRRFATESSWDLRNNLVVDWDAFVLAARENYTPRPGSPLRGKVVDPGPGPDGLSLRPERQYRHPRGSVALSGPAQFPGALQGA